MRADAWLYSKTQSEYTCDAGITHNLYELNTKRKKAKYVFCEIGLEFENVV